MCTDETKNAQEQDGNIQDTDVSSGDENPSPFMKTVWIVVAFVGISGLAAILIAMLGDDPLSEAQQTIFDSLVSAFTLGSLAIIGLVEVHRRKQKRYLSS